MYSFVKFVIILVFIQTIHGQIKAPPQLEKPLLLDSFIPASMQIIAYLTELMKYDLKPQKPGGVTTTTTTTTIRPTSSHKPGIYSPSNPLGPQIYFARDLTYEEYVERLINPHSTVKFTNYFDRYRFPLVNGKSLQEQQQQENSKLYSIVYGQLPNDLDLYLGRAPTDLLKLVNENDDDKELNRLSNDDRVQKFTDVYDDDTNLRLVLLRQKQKPPTRAYVTLLSLYDMLNKESKKLGLNKYSGYKENILNELAEISTGTSTDQLRLVLTKITQRRDTNNPQILSKIDTLVKELEQSSSYISAALRYIPPLPFVL